MLLTHISKKVLLLESLAKPAAMYVGLELNCADAFQTLFEISDSVWTKYNAKWFYDNLSRPDH